MERGGGLQNGRDGGQVKFYPCENFPPFKKKEKKKGGGGRNMFYPVLRGRGPQQVLDPRFSHFVAPRKI